MSKNNPQPCKFMRFSLFQRWNITYPVKPLNVCVVQAVITIHLHNSSSKEDTVHKHKAHRHRVFGPVFTQPRRRPNLFKNILHSKDNSQQKHSIWDHTSEQERSTNICDLRFKFNGYLKNSKHCTKEWSTRRGTCGNSATIPAWGTGYCKGHINAKPEGHVPSVYIQ